MTLRDTYITINEDGTESVTYQNWDWEKIKLHREKGLALSDFTMLHDIFNNLTSEQQTQVINFRQALRDITETYTNAEDVEWPDVPDCLMDRQMVIDNLNG
ncbi:MAG: hypothetical protein CL833_12020 [Crocinitomicaceae bacterium]|nr:hypothetical protein [Crocinitomicaceae bacterium]|tara:strand:- start:3562 stop:3864 length:303 start_codon:yes stop_codon:yes gene_type:complete